MNEGGFHPDSFLDFSQYNSTPIPSVPGTPTTPSSSISCTSSSAYLDGSVPSSSTFFNASMSIPPFFGFHHDSTAPLMFSSVSGSAGTPPFVSSASLGGMTPFPLPALPPGASSMPASSSSSAPVFPPGGFKSSPPSTPSPPSSFSSSSPTQPSSFSSSSGACPPSAKRKRTTKEDLMKVNSSIQWDDYTPPETNIVQLLENLSPIDPFGMTIGHIDKNAIVETEKCIIYRQNQFKLQCALSGSLKNYTTPTLGHPLASSQILLGSLDGRLFEVDGLYLKMYAFKQSGEETTEEFKVPIHQVGPSRTKKETKPPEIMPIANGGGFFDKLQFQASTHVGSESYFRIVVAVMAKIQDKYHMVAAKISPKLLVRAQNPGRYNPNNPNNTIQKGTCTAPSTPWNNNSPSDNSNDEDGDSSSRNQTPSPPPSQPACAQGDSAMTEPKPWVQDREVVYYYGKVGVNTENPQEALTVNGNIMVTGDIFKPSDKRLKSNFVSVNPASQLNVINKLNIYDYDITAGGQLKRERGVIAQELAQVLPAAVQKVGNYTMANGTEVDNLLVVNERMLLMENIGATQYLDKVLQEEREEINYVNSKVSELAEEEKKKSSYVMKSIQNMGSLIMSEDFREAPRSEWIYCGFSICGLGPAWSIFVLGFFFTPAWFLGALYVSSPNHVKRAAGIANILMLFVVGLMVTGMFFAPDKTTPLRGLISCVIVVGIAFLAVVSCYKRQRERLRQKVLKHRLEEVISNDE